MKDFHTIMCDSVPLRGEGGGLPAGPVQYLLHPIDGRVVSLQTIILETNKLPCIDTLQLNNFNLMISDNCIFSKLFFFKLFYLKNS